MKKKLSISIEGATIDKLDDYISDGTFRNKSHLIELALNKYLEDLK
ncbi:MAG: hypothetical protein KAI26_01260 [Nanoarchaeota archaeon]|nr:hypothetical protein [Nanoarchaeota archaeon]